MQLLGEGMDTDILIRNLTIGFNEALGYITVTSTAQVVEPIKDNNGPVPGLLVQEELKIIWLAYSPFRWYRYSILETGRLV